jgi:uncharacterized protein
LVPRIVIDTNVYISAIFWGGKPRQVVDLGRNRRISIFTSSEIQGEIERKLKTKFQIDEREIAQILLDYLVFTLPIKSRHKVAVVDADPDDDKFIECALASKAGYIVSGDKHLLNLKNYQGIEIKKPAEFLEIFENGINSVPAEGYV